VEPLYQSTQHCLQEDSNIQISHVCKARGTLLLCTVFEYPHFRVLRLCQYRQDFLSSVWMMLHQITKVSDNRTKKFYIANAKAYHWSWSWASSIHVPKKKTLVWSCFQSPKCCCCYWGPLFCPNHIGHFLLACFLHKSSQLGGLPALTLSKTMS
jgi:hypothetical protein